MMRYIQLFLVSLAACLTFITPWLGVVARSIYQQHAGFVMIASPNCFAAGKRLR